MTQRTRSAIALLFLLAPARVLAHPGARDAFGCHHDWRHGGIYHCHNTPRNFRQALPATLLGLTFALLPALLGRTNEPPPQPSERPLPPAPPGEIQQASIKASSPPAVLPPPVVEEPRGRLALAQLYLIRGPIVSRPPQAFNGQFLATGKANIVLSGNRLLTGEYEMFEPTDQIRAKYEPRILKNPDNLKAPRGADAKGFAALSDGRSTEIECAYMISKTTGRGEGFCADNESNVYRLVFD